MAKLYWRVKINNVWTWIAADDQNTIVIAPSVEAIIMHQGGWNNFNYDAPPKEEE